MATFLSGDALDDKLTDIIWKAKKQLIILSPFIRLDDYCKKVFSNLKESPELEICIVFGKNENNTSKSFTYEDIEFFKEFKNIAIFYCSNLHAKFYANDDQALLTSLNLLGKSMTNNVEFGISYTKGAVVPDQLYTDSLNTADNLIKTMPCIFMKRPVYKSAMLVLSKKYVTSEVLFDVVRELYDNLHFRKKYYNQFEKELWESKEKPLREISQVKKYVKNEQSAVKYKVEPIAGYCIRTGVKIPFNPAKPLCYEAYQTWAIWENRNFRENYCHKTGKESYGKTSMNNPIL